MPPIPVEQATRIAFHFRAEGPDKGPGAVEKADDQGRKRKYLQGVSSGLKVDAHGERMTEKAIASFMTQAKTGDVLVYADRHGFAATEDIGILSDAQVLEGGDWWTEYRLYDEHDQTLGVDKASVERAQKLWLQVNGRPPYKHPKQKGFSIEGFVPDERGAMEMTQTGRKAINEVKLDGVVVVPRPAYEDSIANAVYKALGENLPGAPEKTIAGQIRTIVEQGEQEEEYFRQRYLIGDAADDLVRRIMSEDDDGRRRERLEAVYDEYKSMMVDLVLRNPDAFEQAGDMALARSADSEERIANLQKALFTSFTDLQSLHDGQEETVITKSMTAEEQAILGNISSLIDQLNQAAAGSASAPAEQTASDLAPAVNKTIRKGVVKMDEKIKVKIMNDETLDDTEKLAVLQALGGAISEESDEETSPTEPEEVVLNKDESTASDSAEERLGDQEETTDDAIAAEGDNMKDVVKAVTKSLEQSLVKAVTPIAEQVKAQGDAIDTLMAGFGITEEVFKGLDEKDVTPSVKKVAKTATAPATDTIPVSTVSDLMEMVTKASQRPDDQLLIADTPLVEGFEVRKSQHGQAEASEGLGNLVVDLLTQR